MMLAAHILQLVSEHIRAVLAKREANTAHTVPYHARKSAKKTAERAHIDRVGAKHSAETRCCMTPITNLQAQAPEKIAELKVLFEKARPDASRVHRRIDFSDAFMGVLMAAE